MMNETSYMEEIRLSRALAKEIESVTKQYGEVVPHNVWLAYSRLVEHYRKQQDEGIM